ncbi:HDOD domain-containing protein [Acidihalobacter prosperus]
MIKPELPVLASTLERLDALERDPRLSAKELEHALTLDPALTIAVLHRAVNVHHRHIDSPITTLLQAAMMLGIAPIRNLAAELPRAEDSLSETHLGMYKTALGRAALSGRFGLFIARERRELEPGEIALSSLLAPLGELALWKVAAANMCEFERLRRQAGVHPQQAAHIVFGTDIGDLGHTLAASWGLPELLQTTLSLHQALTPRQTAPILASRLAWHALGDWQTLRAEADLRACARHLDLDFNTLIQHIDDIVGEFETETAALYDLPTLQVLSGTQMREMPPPPKPLVCSAPDQDWITLGRQRLERAGTPADIVQALSETLYNGLGMDRVVFARYSKDEDGERLETESLLGTDYEYGFHNIRLPLGEGQFFSQLLKKPAGVWLRGPDDSRLAKLVPSELIELSGTDRFFCLSLFAGDTPLGIVYTDRRHADCALTETQFAAFKRLGALAINRLRTLTA